ncbi:UpxY family transcription antiterminator [Prolixibacteraceae bacterium Z1-6]|uniref:UpxY family transcription antiterminator n=1 Tax=Draconibacterium aestuarii TaxID=2998507 RepID=A0A9X3JA01_9BACT|nr:UpxY family transcription antiterminator [Prolixibacteraceae bacterium Z1-6]
MKTEKPSYKWYVIYTKANREKKIIKSLNEQNLTCYLPLQKTLRIWSDRKKWIEAPLFKSYVFVKVSYKEFFDVLCVPGVICYVCFGGKAQPIPDKQIEDIKVFVEQDKTAITITKESIIPGTKAEVLYGPLKGVQGEIVKFNGKFRILIRIPMMGYCLHANISKDEIKIIEPQKPTDSLKKKSQKVRIGHNSIGNSNSTNPYINSYLPTHV